MRDGEILYYILVPLWPWTRFILLLTISFILFLECRISWQALAFDVLHNNPQNVWSRGRSGRCWRYSGLDVYKSSAHIPSWLFLSHVSKWLVLGQNWGSVRPRFCWFFPSHPAGYEKPLWFCLSRNSRLVWQPNWFPELGKKCIFWTLSVEHTCICSLLLQ